MHRFSRRNLLGMLAGIPFLGWLIAKQLPAKESWAIPFDGSDHFVDLYDSATNEKEKIWLAIEQMTKNGRGFVVYQHPRDATAREEVMKVVREKYLDQNVVVIPVTDQQFFTVQCIPPSTSGLVVLREMIDQAFDIH